MGTIVTIIGVPIILLRKISIGIVGPLLVHIREITALVVSLYEIEVVMPKHTNRHDLCTTMTVLHLFVEVEAGWAEAEHGQRVNNDQI